MKKCNIESISVDGIAYKLYVTDHSITCDQGFPWKVFTENKRLLSFKCHTIDASDFENFWKTNKILMTNDINDAKIYRISLYLREAVSKTVEHEYKCETWTETINVPWGEVYEINFQVGSCTIRFDCMASGIETEFGQTKVTKLEYIDKRDVMKQFEQLKTY
jgi:hypothetical protein